MIFLLEIIIYGGDFIKVLPVVPKGTEPEIVDACLNQSYIWDSVKPLRLKINMRIKQLQGVEVDKQNFFSQFLLAIGEAKLETCVDDNNNLDAVEIPEQVFSSSSRDEFIDLVYPQLITTNFTQEIFNGRAILAPKNADVDILNEIHID